MSDNGFQGDLLAQCVEEDGNPGERGILGFVHDLHDSQEYVVKVSHDVHSVV